MSKFLTLQRNNSIEKFKEKRKRRIKFTDFTSDGQLPKKIAQELPAKPKKSFIDEQIDLNDYFDPVFDELKTNLDGKLSISSDNGSTDQSTYDKVEGMIE